MSLAEKIFHNKNRAVRIAARTPVVLLSPVIFFIVLAEAFFVAGYKSARSDGWSNVKELAGNMRQGYLD